MFLEDADQNFSKARSTAEYLAARFRSSPLGREGSKQPSLALSLYGLGSQGTFRIIQPCFGTDKVSGNKSDPSFSTALQLGLHRFLELWRFKFRASFPVSSVTAV